MQNMDYYYDFSGQKFGYPLSLSINSFERVVFSRIPSLEICYVLKGDYEETKELWQKVLAADENNQLAYRGLAMVYYMEGNNRAALKAAKQASDYTVYDLAWSAVLSEFIANNFIWMILVLVLLVALIIVLTVQIKKKKINIVPNRKVKIALNSFFYK